MIKKDNLFKLVAELVEKLVDYGCKDNDLADILKYYGFTEKQIESWYGLQRSDLQSNWTIYGE